MTTTTPEITIPTVAIKSKNPLIAVAFIPWPDLVTALSHILLRKALNAGMERHSVKTESIAGYFRPMFCVNVFEVSPAAKEQAMAALRETLASMKLTGISILAVLSPGEDWNVIGGLYDGGLRFAGMFLNPREMEEFEKDLAAREKQHAASCKLLEAVFQRLSSQPGSEP